MDSVTALENKDYVKFLGILIDKHLTWKQHIEYNSSKVSKIIGPIGHCGKYHNTLCLSPQILHEHCFQFLLGLKMTQRENKTMVMQNLGGQTKSIMVFSEMTYSKIAAQCTI